MSLRTQRRFRAEWLTLGTTLLVLAGVLVWTLSREHASTTSQERDRLQGQVHVIDENLIRQFEGAKKALSGVAAELPRLDASVDTVVLTGRLKLLVGAMPGISSMLVLDADGTIVSASRDGLVGKNFKQRDYFQAPLQSRDPSTMHVSPPFTTTIGNYVVVVSQAVIDARGQFIGVVTATLDPEYFNFVLSSVLYAPDMRTTLVHRDGKLFLATPTLAPGALDDTASRMSAARTVDRADLHMDKPMMATVSRDTAEIYASWRGNAAQAAILFFVISCATSVALLLSQQRRHAAERVEAVVRRERQIASERVELALRGADLGLWDLHVPTDTFVVNGRERAMLGYGPNDPLPHGAAWRDLIHRDDRARVDAAILPHLRGEADTYGVEHRMRHRDGHDLWLSSRAMIVERDAGGAPLRIVGTHLDITERRRSDELLARSEERLSLALEASSLALFDWDIAAGTIFHSAQAAAMRGDVPVETNGPVADMQAYVHTDDLPMVLARLKAAVTGKSELYHAEYRLRRTNGDWRWIRAGGRVVERDANGRAMRLAGTYADIHDRKVAENKLRRLAEFDTLTGLPNRALFHDRLQQAMARAARGKPMALLFLDIDHFKGINDTLGHEAGDQLLKVFAMRMQGAVRESDTVARLAGDEFTIILEAVRDVEDAKRLAQKLVDTARKPLMLAGESVQVTTSIGVALCVPGESDDAALLRRADLALYEAKRQGRDRYSCEAIAVTMAVT